MIALASQLIANAEAVSWCPGIGQTFFDGLWAGSGTITREYSVVVQRIINMGFNAVRVPFSFPVTLYLSSLVARHWKLEVCCDISLEEPIHEIALRELQGRL